MKNQNENNYYLLRPHFDLRIECLQNIFPNNLHCHHFINKEPEVRGGSELFPDAHRELKDEVWLELSLFSS